jgi:hypothetical protein
MRHGTRLAVLTAGTITAATAGVAFALWSADGSGQGSATTATAQSLTVTAASTGAGIYPGGPAGAIGFEVTNPNPYDVRLTSVSYGALGTGGSTCAADHVTLSGSAPTTVDLLVPAGESVAAEIPGVLSLATAAGDACQGVPLTVGLSFTGSQAG